MKKVVSGKELQDKIKESIQLLCDTVKQTLGPKGNNVLIDHSLFTPFITNDGATIAKNIESEDEIVNTILEIAKEASLKTNETVGDGTTTTLVLLQSIYNSSLECIEQGTNPILLKKELDIYLKEVLKTIEKLKLDIDKEKMNSIASIASNDEIVGNFLSEVYQKVTLKSAITIEEVEKPVLEVTYQKGYYLETELASDYFLKDQKEIEFQNANILILESALLEIEDIAFILNDSMKNKKNLLIFAEDFEENLIREIVAMNLDGELNCCLVKIREYGMRKKDLEKDLEMITNAKVINTNISLENIGFCKRMHITKEKVCIHFEKTEKISKYIDFLKEEVKLVKDEYDQSFYQKRLAMFSQGMATIKVGASTKTETHEKKMRIEDALCALESAKDGVLLGGGVTLLMVAEQIKGNTNAEKIFKSALEVPFKQILINSGMEFETLKKEIINNHFQKIFNVQKEKWEEINFSSVFDSFYVTTEALKNAVSIATMLFTTNSLVINEYTNNVNKENEYTEI